MDDATADGMISHLQGKAAAVKKKDTPMREVSAVAFSKSGSAEEVRTLEVPEKVLDKLKVNPTGGGTEVPGLDPEEPANVEELLAKSRRR